MTVQQSKSKDDRQRPDVSSGFELSDTGNKDRFLTQYETDVLYVPEWEWLVWDGIRWTRDPDGLTVQGWMENIARGIRKEADAAPDKDQYLALAKHATRSESAQKIKSALELVKSSVKATVDQFDSDPWKLNCLTSTIDLKTGDCNPHKREDKITKLAPVEYDPAASSPRWSQFLEEVLPDKDVRHFVHKAVGYSATADCSEEIFLMLHGQGRNGKSKFLEAIADALGDYSRSAPMGLLLQKRDKNSANMVSGLCGARFVHTSEIGENKYMDEELVKILTGRDTVSAKKLYKEYFEFKPTHKIWIATNHRPVVRGNDFAMWRRVALVPFKIQIPKESVDKNLPKKLKAEAPGILQWILEGCLFWQQEGLDFPKAVRAATSDYRRASDVIGEFLDEKVKSDRACSVSAKELFRMFKKWCEENEEKVWNQRTFGIKLTERGYQREKRRDGIHWLGLRLADSVSQSTLQVHQGRASA